MGEFLDAGVLPVFVCMYIGGVRRERETERDRERQRETERNRERQREMVKEKYIAKQYKV